MYFINEKLHTSLSIQAGKYINIYTVVVSLIYCLSLSNWGKISNAITHNVISAN